MENESNNIDYDNYSLTVLKNFSNVETRKQGRILMFISLVSFFSTNNIISFNKVSIFGFEFSEVNTIYLVAAFGICCLYFVIIHAIDIKAEISTWKINLALVAKAKNSPKVHTEQLTQEYNQKTKDLYEKTDKNFRLKSAKFDEVNARDIAHTTNPGSNIDADKTHHDLIWDEYKRFAEQKDKENQDLLNEYKVFVKEIVEYSKKVEPIRVYTRLYNFRLWFEAIFPIICGVSAVGYSLYYFYELLMHHS